VKGAELVEQSVEVGWERGFKAKELLGDRVGKSEACSVESLAWEVA
jgi:hypothetical protein